LGAQLSSSDISIPWINLEQSLIEYKNNPSSSAFDLSRVSLIPVQSETKEKKSKKPAAPVAQKEAVAPKVEASNLSNIPQFAHLGPVHKSSKPLELTESETEYVVSCVKHVFKDNHIVLQFICTNTLKEQQLENVSVKLGLGSVKNVKIESIIPLPTLAFGTPGSIYVCLKREDGVFPTGSFEAVLKFTAKDVDAQTGEVDSYGNEDEYPIEAVELSTSDYVQTTFVPSFQEKWDQVGDEFEISQTYSLSTMKSLPDAVKAIIDFLGMQPCERSDQVPAKKTKHTLFLSGVFLGEIPVLARTRMKFEEGAGVQIELTVRSNNDDISTLLASAI